MFFLALGVRLLQGYGQTEASPVISANPPDRIKIDTVGPPLEGVEVRIAEDGEILVRGDNGDEGLLERSRSHRARRSRTAGCIPATSASSTPTAISRITDRKSDFIKNSGGDMISPARVEGVADAASPRSRRRWCYGDRRPYLVAVIVPRPGIRSSRCRAHGRATAALARDPGLHKAIGAAVARVNAALPAVERVRRFIIAAEPFTIANGQMTPTLKIRRHAVGQAYGEALEALYDGKG